MNTFQDEREAFEIAAHRLMTLQFADSLSELLKNPAWKHIRDFQVEWAERLHEQLRTTECSDPAKALDTLRRWQLADEMLRREDLYIQQIMDEADRIRGNVTYGDALLMEKFNNEQSESSGDSGGHRAGY